MKEEKNLVCLNCMVCGNSFMSKEPQTCCSGRDCGCMGQPIEPVVCSPDCYQKLMNKDKKVNFQFVSIKP